MKGVPHTLKKARLFHREVGLFIMPVRGKGMRVLLTAGSRYFFGFGKVKEEMSGMRVIRAIT